MYNRNGSGIRFFSSAPANNSYAQNEKYRAKLDGKNEVPPLNTTSEGVINFKTKSGMMTWKMNVTGLNDATAVNIHQGKVGEKGDVVDLMKASKHKDTAKGMLMRGNVTDSSLTGAMAGKTLADLQTAIANGDTYVNLVTSDHPDGELRGQINSREITQHLLRMLPVQQTVHLKREFLIISLFLYPF